LSLAPLRVSYVPLFPPEVVSQGLK
jgi:hypothetical protein